MATKTVKINSNTLDKVSYDTKGKDLTLYLKDGAVFRYLDVPADIIDNVIGLKKDKVGAESIHRYIFKSLTKQKDNVTGRGRYRRTQSYTVGKYQTVQIRESDAQIKAKKGGTKHNPTNSVKQDLKTFSMEVSDEIKNVKSTDIKTLRWFSNGTLEVEFRSDNSVYSYSDVPKAYWNSLKNRNKKRVLTDAKTEKYSVGKFFQEKIVKNQKDFNYKKVEGK
jgi:hypothetical protein